MTRVKIHFLVFQKLDQRPSMHFKSFPNNFRLYFFNITEFLKTLSFVISRRCMNCFLFLSESSDMTIFF